MSKDHAGPERGSQDARRHALDHQARSEWLDKDDGMKAAWKESQMERDEFIRHNQHRIDKAIVDSYNNG